jgi:hypothetical protein
VQDNPDEEEFAVEEAPAEAPFDEPGFQDWYSRWADTTGLDPNPDDERHFYDYRAAFAAGEEPTFDESDGKYHWPSQHKADDHPNRYVNGMDTKTGQPQYPDATEDPMAAPLDSAQEPDQEGDLSDPGSWRSIPIQEQPTTQPEAPGKTLGQKALDTVGTILSPGKAEAAPDPNDPKTWEPVEILPPEQLQKQTAGTKGWEPVEILPPEQLEKALSLRDSEAAKKATGRDFWGQTEEEKNTAETKKFNQQKQANAIAQPMIRKWTDNHPVFGVLSDAIKDSDWWNDAVSGAAMDQGGILWEQRRLLMLQGKDLPPEALQLLKTFDQMQAYNSQKTGIASFVPAAAEILGQQINSALSEESNPYMAGLAAALAAGGTAIYLSPVFGPAAPAAVLGAAATAGAAAMKAVSFRRSKAVEGGQAFSELLLTKDRDGKLVDPKVAAVAAGIIGDINGALELAGLEAAFQLIPGLKDIAKQGIRPFLKSSTLLRHKLFELARGYAIGVAGETGTEALQELPAIVTDAILKDQSVAGKVFSKETYDQLAEVVEKVGKGMALLGLGGAAMGAPGLVKTVKGQEAQNQVVEDITDKQAAVVEAGLGSNDTTRPQVQALIDDAKKKWADNPLIGKLEALLGKSADTDAAGPSRYSPAAQEDLDALTNFIKKNIPDFGDFGIEAAPERSGMGIVQRMGDATGSKVVFFKGNDAAWQLNGAYDADTNTIFIHEDAENPYAVVLGHETLHQLKSQHADLFTNLQSAVIEGGIGFDAYLSRLNEKRAQAKLPALTVQDAMAREEYVADFVGEQFQDPKFWEKVNKKDPNLGQRLAQLVSDLIDRLRSSIMLKGGVGLKQREVKEYVDKLDAVQAALASTYVEFSRRNTKVQDQTVTTVGGAIATALSPGAAEAKVTTGKVASVKFMITKQDEARLKDLGYGPEQINQMTPEVAGSILANNIAPPEAAKSKIIEPDPTDESTWEVIDLTDEVKPEEEIIDLVDEVKPEETKEQEFKRLWNELTPEQKRHLDFSVDDKEMSVDEKITFVKAEMAVKREAPAEVAPEAPVKKKKPAKIELPKTIRPSRVSTLRGRIKAMGNLRKGNFAAEFQDVPGAFPLFINGTVSLDIAEITLKEEGWLAPDENLIDVIRGENNSRGKVAGEGVKKLPQHMTAQEKEVAAALEYEAEGPPEGEYVTMDAEDLPMGERMVIIDDRHAEWDWYEVIEKTEFAITLRDGKTITLKPGDLVQVLRSDLPSERLTNFKKDVADYRKKNSGKVFVADELSDAWDYLKEQIATGGVAGWATVPGIRISREEFEVISQKVDEESSLDEGEFKSFMQIISYMEKLNKVDPEFTKAVETKETLAEIDEKGFSVAPKGMISADIPEGATVLIKGKEYENLGLTHDGFVELKAVEGKEVITLEPFEDAGIEGIRAAGDAPFSLRDKDMEIDVVAMDEAGNTALVKEKAGVAVAENKRQIEFAKRLLECLNS